MRATTSQQHLITAVFEAAHLIPGLDCDRTEYAVASVLLEEAWVAQR